MRNRKSRKHKRSRPSGPRKAGPKKRERQLNPRLQRELKRANHLSGKGEHANAAQIFIKLAENAQDRGIRRPASMLFIQAAHSLLLSNTVDEAIDRANDSLKMLAADRRWRRFQRAGNRFADALVEGGHLDQATNLRSWMKAEIPEDAKGMENERQDDDFDMPSLCPFCGAPLSLEEISKKNTRLIECQYCGSVVKARKIE